MNLGNFSTLSPVAVESHCDLYCPSIFVPMTESIQDQNKCTYIKAMSHCR